MIEIGNIVVDETEVAAVYPSSSTPGKIWLLFRSGRTVWTMATIEGARRRLSMVAAARATDDTEAAAALLAAGYRYVARDESGIICAYKEKPHRALDVWVWDGANAVEELNKKLFSFVTWETEALDLQSYMHGATARVAGWLSNT